jgi:hypothetical protein
MFLLFALLILSVAGCSEKVAVKPSDEAVKAQRAVAALQEMERAYKARELKTVTGLVSPDLKGGYSEFETRVRKDLDAFAGVRLDINVERVEESGDLAKVAFSWYGVWTDPAGKEAEGRGNTVFVFKDAEGRMSLVEYIGDSPFGVVR